MRVQSYSRECAIPFPARLIASALTSVCLEKLDPAGKSALSFPSSSIRTKKEAQMSPFSAIDTVVVPVAMR